MRLIWQVFKKIEKIVHLPFVLSVRRSFLAKANVSKDNKEYKIPQPFDTFLQEQKYSGRTEGIIQSLYKKNFRIELAFFIINAIFFIFNSYGAYQATGK